jgi:uncharacterized protein (TIGR02246 family)
MKPAYLYLGLFALLGAACSRLDTTQRDVAAISAVRAGLDEAIVARDAAKVVGLFTDDAVYMQPEEREVVGRNALMTFLQDAYTQPGPAPKGRRVPSEVQVAGVWAFEWGRVEAIRPATGGADTWVDGKYLHVYHRQSDGRWKIARASYTSNPPQQARLAAR